MVFELLPNRNRKTSSKAGEVQTHQVGKVCGNAFCQSNQRNQSKKHFTEHDLRAKVASDADSLQHAIELLAHADSRTT